MGATPQTVFLQGAENTGANMLFFSIEGLWYLLMITLHCNLECKIQHANILKHVANNVNPGFLMPKQISYLFFLYTICPVRMKPKAVLSSGQLQLFLQTLLSPFYCVETIYWTHVKCRFISADPSEHCRYIQYMWAWMIHFLFNKSIEIWMKVIGQSLCPSHSALASQNSSLPPAGTSC